MTKVTFSLCLKSPIHEIVGGEVKSVKGVT